MNYFLTFFLFFILMMTILINKRDLAAPSVLFCVSFFISSFVLSLNTQNWNYEISINTVIAIVFGVVSFVIGCGSYKISKIRLLGGRMRVKRIGIGNAIGGMVNTYAFIILGFLAISVQLASIYFEVHTLNIFNSLALRTYRGIKGVRFLNIIKLFTPLLEAIAILQVNKIMEYKSQKKKVSFIEYIPIIELFFFTSFSSGRIIVIYLFFYIVFEYIIIFQHKVKIGFTKIVKYSLIAMVILMLAFYGLGHLTGKSQIYESGLVENISLYAGSSLAALDVFLRDFEYSVNNFGKMTIVVGMANLLAHFGIDLKKIVANEYLMIGTMKHSTNIYSMIRPMVHDYNYIGMCIVLFLLGRFYEFLYCKAIKEYSKGHVFWLSLYVYAAGYLSIAAIEDKVFASFFTITGILFVIIVGLFSKKIEQKIK